MTTLLEALNNVKQEDLDEVNKRIDLLKNELGSMTELKKVLEIKLNITPSVSDRMKAMRAARGTHGKKQHGRFFRRTAFRRDDGYRTASRTNTRIHHGKRPCKADHDH